MLSSLRAISCSIQMISWSLSQMAWSLSFICFTWASDQRQPSQCYRRPAPFSRTSSMQFCWPPPPCLNNLNKWENPQRLISNWTWLCSPSIHLGLTHWTHWTDWSFPHCCVLQYPRDTHAIVVPLMWFRQFSIALWSAVPTADISFSSFSMGCLTLLIIRGTIGGRNPALCAGEWQGTWWVNTLMGDANEGNVQHGKKGRGGLSLAHRAACGGWGLWAPSLWSSCSHLGIHYSLHGSS